ncbi:C-C motif chemokine 3 [Columba livia]|uniref:C-C motif chemokine 3-like n=1 Tax=Columba livia TaxID=8932 RepID=A0A2I0LPQ4_COLLI|nr:C-C motif chemokine 3 [Columba livia]PKK19407.1 C-C motif chemokine 3-like [Columba livia]
MLAARTVLLLTMLLTFSLHRAAAYDSPTECCYNHAEKPIRHIEYFYETPNTCSLPAVVIVTLKGDKVCADPKKRWVMRAMKRFQRKK